MKLQALYETEVIDELRREASKHLIAVVDYDDRTKRIEVFVITDVPPTTKEQYDRLKSVTFTGSNNTYADIEVLNYAPWLNIPNWFIEWHDRIAPETFKLRWVKWKQFAEEMITNYPDDEDDFDE